MSLNFPKNPVDGAEFSLGGRTWRYNSTYGVWDKVPDPADGGVESFNGVTGAVVTDALVLPCAGISCGGATFTDNVILTTSSGDIALIVKADTDNNQENDNPLIRLEQDGAAISASIGMNGNNDVQFDGAIANMFYIEADGSAGNQHHGIQFATSNTARMTIDSEGGVSCGMLQVAGISLGAGGITFGNGEVIRNNPDGSIQILPNDASGNHYGIEIDSTEWGHGPIITAIEEDGTQVNNAIRFDSDVVLGTDASSTPSRLMFDTSASRGMQLNAQGDGTVMFGANAGYGTFAVASAADMHRSERSMSLADKVALGITNPQFFVYSKDADNANDYIRIEHDQTDANIFSGAGNINLVPADGSAVGISGGLHRPNLKDYSEHVNAIGTVTSNTAVNFENGNVQTVTVGGNCQFSFSNPPLSGQAGTITLIITNGGAHTTTFASAVKFPGGVAPTLTTSGVDIVSFLTTDAGTTINGFVGGINFS